LQSFLLTYPEADLSL